LQLINWVTLVINGMQIPNKTTRTDTKTDENNFKHNSWMELANLSDLITQLQIEGHSVEVPLPQLVVCGSQVRIVW